MNRFEDADSGSNAEVDEELLERARRAAKTKMGFYRHAGTWALVSLAIIFVDVLSGPGWWFFWPVLGWGIAVAFHAGSVFFGDGFQQRLEDREVERMMRRRD